MTRLETRKNISDRYIAGMGIEIGALHNPLTVPPSAHVKYVDRMSKQGLMKHYPELGNEPLVDVDIIDDGETLKMVADSTMDFVIANHFLEHCQDPLRALQNMLRVTKIGGVVYIAVPDKKYTFDIDRSVTRFEHIEKDYIDGPQSSRESHFEEWVEYVDKIRDEKAKKERKAQLMSMNYSIHFHVWTQTEILELLVKAKKFFPYEVEMFMKNVDEIIFVLSKA